MEQNLQTLLDRILRRIFVKKLLKGTKALPENREQNLPTQNRTPFVIALVISDSLRRTRPVGIEKSPEYCSLLRQKTRACFIHLKERILASNRGVSFESKIQINTIGEYLDEILLLEYSDQSLTDKIARLQDLYEIYQKMSSESRSED
jgi:hypothetical protein